MKERPILFNGEMVRALLAGRKTQTRRVVKWKSPLGVVSSKGYATVLNHLTNWVPWTSKLVRCFIKSPYGVPGDRLWVRETHRTWCAGTGEDGWSCRYRADDVVSGGAVAWDEGPDFNTPEDAGIQLEGKKWTPSIFMPRWASRIMLEITDVRVERVQDIEEDDAKDEGVTPVFIGTLPVPGPVKSTRKPPITALPVFRLLWDSINKKRGFNWSSNPWVWVVQFKVVKP